MAVEEGLIGGHWCAVCQRWWGHFRCSVAAHRADPIHQLCDECDPSRKKDPRDGFFLEEDELTQFVRKVRKTANVL